MVDIRLTDDGDLFSQNGFIRGEAEIIQAVKIRIRRHLGEWVLNPSAGVPYIEWSEGTSTVVDETIEDVIRSEVEGVQGVIEVLSITAELNALDETYTIEANVLIEADDPEETRVQAQIIENGGVARTKVFT